MGSMQDWGILKLREASLNTMLFVGETSLQAPVMFKGRPKIPRKSQDIFSIIVEKTILSCFNIEVS